MKKKFKIIFLFLFLGACDYQPIFSSKDFGFSISDIEIKNKNNLTNQIVRSLKKYNGFGENRVYTIELSAKKNKDVAAKDSKGNIKTYRINIVCDFKIYEKNEILKSKKITKNFMFNNDSDKFKLRKYESKIDKNLIDEVIKDLILELYSS
tara:strand:+ start:698 stop:1150 length:453 start_codon:yes stop_codon:yes gene_type:complete